MKYIVIEVDDRARSYTGSSIEEATRTYPESTWFGFPARILAVTDHDPRATA
jgi:hypothetical protein